MKSIVDRARELFTLENGKLFWKQCLSPRAPIGSEAGARTPRARYGRVTFDGRTYFTHQIVFAIHYGRFPNLVDHFDGDTSNNRPENLRETTQSRNLMNTVTRSDNTSGRKGISFESGKYRAYINLDGKRHNLGRFNSLEDAADARFKAEEEFHGKFSKFDGEQAIDVYLAGSLRNDKIPYLARLLSDGLNSSQVFYQWHSAGPNADDYWRDHMQACGFNYTEALNQPCAENVFQFDKKHIDKSKTMVLAYPAGKSGHLELGYHVGRGLPGYILLESTEPERYDVMAKFATGVTDSLEELCEWIRKDLDDV